MSPDNPFLKALLANPEDDTLRLAMADWLDENDQPARAEFIRLQIELAVGVEDRERRIALELRQAELLNAHDKEWVRPLLDALDGREAEGGGWSFGRATYDVRSTGTSWGGCVFRRGFAEYFHLPAPVINRHGEKLARQTPVRELYLSPCQPLNVATLCKRSWLQSVTALYLPSTRLNARAIVALIECPYLGNLKTLDVVTVVNEHDVPEWVAKAFSKRFGRHLVRSQPA